MEIGTRESRALRSMRNSSLVRSSHLMETIIFKLIEECGAENRYHLQLFAINGSLVMAKN